MRGLLLIFIAASGCAHPPVDATNYWAPESPCEDLAKQITDARQSQSQAASDYMLDSTSEHATAVGDASQQIEHIQADIDAANCGHIAARDPWGPM